MEKPLRTLNQPDSFEITRNAILLLGPTGSGKTPLGQMMEKEGLGGKTCVHFDFGQALRASVKKPDGFLTNAECQIIQHSLKTGDLLANEHFPIAKKLLANYLCVRNAAPNTLILLNGLPRHVGQARDMESVVNMRMAIVLDCAPSVAWRRIQLNTGGDREDRVDDTEEKVAQRIEVFRERTAPLVQYYRETGIPVLTFTVEAQTTSQEMLMHFKANPYLI